jgi:hypothetical protein
VARPDAGQSHAAVPGRELAIRLPHAVAPAEALAASGPDGAPVPGLSFQAAGAAAILKGRVEAPGVYRVLKKDRPVHALAVECPAEESDLTPLPAAVLEQWARGGTVRVEPIGPARGASGGTSPDAEDPGHWALFAVASLVLLMAESLALTVLPSRGRTI